MDDSVRRQLNSEVSKGGLSGTRRPAELSSGIGKERFLREIKLAARLMHPHILPLFDSGEDDGALYFVMPYVKGASLRVRLAREGQLPLEDALEITRDIAGALDYAHRQDIVHRSRAAAGD